MEQIKIDIVPVGVAPVAHASQFDNSRQIRFNLFNQGAPYTLTGAETVTMVVNGEEENITNTSDNYVIWDVAEEDCVEAGVIGCEIRIVLGSMLIGSKNFFLEVEMDPYNGKNVHVETVGPADICTFETTLPEPLQSVLVNVLATGGNGTPDNPIPINGFTEANITRCGVNLWDEEWESGVYDTATGNKNSNANYVRAKNKIPCKPSTNYYALVPDNITIVFWDVNETYLGIATRLQYPSSQAFTTPANACFMAFYTHTTTIDKNASINYPETDTVYHAYNGQTYAIAFGQTVYGGVLHIENGRTWFEVTWKSDTLGGISWDYATGASSPSGKIFRSGTICKPRERYSENAVLCSIFGSNASWWFNSNIDNYGMMIDDVGRLYIRDDDYDNDISGFTSALGSTPIYYEIPTPFDIDLTPEVISALALPDSNNVFADCEETTVKYLKAGN